jgi:putative endonuclease
MPKLYFVYMMTNKHHTVLYTGMSGYIAHRGWQHKKKLIDGFTKKYNADKMVYFETFRDVYKAIAREKQIKGWTRKKKEALINKVNPEWNDIYEEAIDQEKGNSSNI